MLISTKTGRSYVWIAPRGEQQLTITVESLIGNSGLDQEAHRLSALSVEDS